MALKYWWKAEDSKGISFISCSQGTTLTFCSLSILSDKLQSEYSLLLILAIEIYIMCASNYLSL